MVEYLSNMDKGHQLKLVVEQLTQDVMANSSQIRVRLYFITGGSGYSSSSNSACALVNGQRLNWSSPSYNIVAGRTVTFIDQTLTIAHQSDGSKTITVSAGMTGSGITPISLTIREQSVAMTSITRTSSLTVGSGVIGSQLVMTIKRPHDALTHTIRYSWGSKSGTIATNVGTSYTWIIPNDFANDIPSSTSGTGTLYLDTFSGSTKTGTQEVPFTAAVPDSMKPSFSGVTLADGNRVARGLLTGNNFLQVISDIQVTFNGSVGSFGSTITGYKAEIVNRNQVTTTNGGSLGIMKFNGSATIRASVYDSRGRQSDTRDVTINVIEYFAPILSFTALRTRENANIIQVVRNAKIAPVTLAGVQKNSMTLSFRVAPIGSTSYTTDTGSASATYATQSSLVNSAANLGGNYPANKSYKIIGVLSDQFTSIEFSVDVSTEAVVMGYDKDGRVGIGKPPELGKAGSLDVAGDIYAGGGQIQQHALTSGDPAKGFIKWDNSTHVDNILDSGFYWAAVGTPTASFGVLSVYRIGGKEVQQIFRSGDGDKCWTRYRNWSTATWTPWKTSGLDQFYPIGSIYQSTVNTSPATTMGGTWQQLTSQTLFGVTVYAWKRTV